MFPHVYRLYIFLATFCYLASELSVRICTAMSVHFLVAHVVTCCMSALACATSWVKSRASPTGTRLPGQMRTITGAAEFLNLRALHGSKHQKKLKGKEQISERLNLTTGLSQLLLSGQGVHVFAFPRDAVEGKQALKLDSPVILKERSVLRTV